MDMTEFYEFAKQFDVIVIFILLYGFAVGSIVYWITDFLHWCWTCLLYTSTSGLG